MVCQGIEIMGSTFGLVELFIYPTTCFYYSWAVLNFMIFAALTGYLFNKQKDDLGNSDFISSAGVSATFVMFLGLIETLIESANGIVMLQQDIFLKMLAIWIIIVGLWFFKTR